jgi:hypothetical protein
MLRTTLVPMLTVTCLTLSAATASAQNVLNPFTWFAPQQSGYGYGYGSASCPNGQCGYQSRYRGMNCAGGNCNLPGACANGQCGLPNNCPNGICPTPRYGTTPNYGSYAPSYRNAPYGNYGNSAPFYDNAPYGTPRYNVPSQYQPYSAQRSMYDRSVTPAGGFDWNTPTTARRNYGPSNSPFYP